MGLHITGITATLRAEGDHLELAQFSGRAGNGTIGGSGTIGLAAPMPVSLTFTAENARPIASDLVTVTIDLHLTVQGDVDGTLNAAGMLHVLRAEIQVPDKMPASVAVLPVRNAPTPGSARRAGRPAIRVAAREAPAHGAGPRRTASGGASAAAGGAPAAAAGVPAAAAGAPAVAAGAPAVAADGTPSGAPTGASGAASGLAAGGGVSAAAAPGTAAPTSTIALNITLDAPQEVLVRGRGLDVELGGTVHIRGTAAQPQPAAA